MQSVPLQKCHLLASNNNLDAQGDGGNNQPCTVAMATATPPNRFTHEEVLRLAGYTRPLARDIFLNSDIDYRHLYSEPATASNENAHSSRQTREVMANADFPSEWASSRSC